MSRRLCKLFIAVAFLGLVVSAAGWIFSYTVKPPAHDPVTGAAAALPAVRMVFPIPADADEYLAPVNGRLEQWEWTGWDRKCYRYSDGISFIWPTIGFAVAAAGLAMARQTRDRPV